MKKVIALLMALVMALSLTACGFPTMDDLCGTWEMDLQQEADTAQTLLENMEFYPEEIALIDLDSLYFVMIVEFNQDGTYRYAFDVDETKAHVREFFADAIDALYENRASLTDTYGSDITDMTQDEFEEAYAGLFSEESVDALLDYFVEYCMDYEILSEDLESGTFRLVVGTILCTVEGAAEEEKLDFKIEEDTLTLIYVDGEEVYTKKN